MRLWDWLRGISRRVRSGRCCRKSRTRPRSAPFLELLETRSLPSAVSFTGDLQTPGVLLIELNESATSTLTVGSADGSSSAVVRVTINGSASSIRQDSSEQILVNLPVALVARIVVVGDQRANVVDLSGVTSRFGLQQDAAVGDQHPVPATLDELKSLTAPSYFGVIVTTSGGDDRVTGSLFRDWVDAGAGDDTVIGGTGEDRLDGGDRKSGV